MRLHPADDGIIMRLKRQARGVARSVRNGSERLLHPLRRWLARRRIRALTDGPLRVVFICHGNICRSPYAAAAFAQRLPDRLRDRVSVDSAGFVGPGRPTPVAGVAAAAGLGIDLSGHVSSPVAALRRHGRTLVAVMDERQARAMTAHFQGAAAVVIQLGDLDPQPIERRRVHDPIEQPEAVFRTTYTRIDRCVAELTRLLENER